jgi:predicted nucleotidyltransferase
MIDLSAAHLALVKKVLKAHVPDREVRAFGSRVVGKAKPYSDLDMVIMGETKLGLGKIAVLRDAFEESNLPFRADILDWPSVSEAFRLVILKRSEVLQKPRTSGPGQQP